MGETNTTPLSVADAEDIKKALLAGVASGSGALCAVGIEEAADALIRAFRRIDAATAAAGPAASAAA